MMKDGRTGLPAELLSKGQTPFDHATTKLKEFLLLEPYPHHPTEERCNRLHSIYKEAIERTEELERNVKHKLASLRRRRSASPAAGWESAGSRPDVHDSKEWDERTKAASSSILSKKIKDRYGNAEGPSKRRKLGGGDSSKESKRSPDWWTRIPKLGDQVAAKVESEEHWFLATVEKHLASQNLFLVADTDTGEERRRQFKLKRSNILALPQKDEVSDATFPIGSRVMTLYPQTTTFYPATICGRFMKGRDGTPDCYVVQFQDDEPTLEGVLPHHTLPACYVRPCPP